MKNKSESYWNKKALEAKKICEGMRKLNPELFGLAELSVKKRMKIVRELVLTKMN